MKSLRMLLVGSLTLTLWGCGGGGGGGPVGGGNSPLESGRAGLNRLASGQQPANAQTLQSILDLFNQAMQTTPGSSEAHFGAAVCLAGMVGQQADTPGVEMPPPPPVTSGGSGASSGVNVWERPPSPPGYTPTPQPILPHQELGLVWNLDRGLSNPLTLLGMLAPVTDLRFGLLPYYGYQGDDPASRQKMLATLNTVSQNLDKVETDPNFSYTLSIPQGVLPGIPTPNMPMGQSKAASRAVAQTITIGLPEVYLFHAYVHSMRAEIALSLAYVRETGSWQSFLPPAGAGSVGASGAGSVGGTTTTIPPVATPKALDKNHDGKLTPDEYLPPSPFLTLRDVTYLQTAQAAMQAVADKAAKGVAGVLARPADSTFLISNTPQNSTALTDLRDKVLPLIQQAATGPVTLTVPHYEIQAQTTTGSKSATLRPRSRVFAIYPYPSDQPPIPTTETVTLNIAAWFAHPPADLKALAPTLPLDASGFPNLDAATYPDPTFAGLFPNGLPKNLHF